MRPDLQSDAIRKNSDGNELVVRCDWNKFPWDQNKFPWDENEFSWDENKFSRDEKDFLCEQEKFPWEKGKFYYEIKIFISQQTTRYLVDKIIYLAVEFNPLAKADFLTLAQVAETVSSRR